MKMQQVFLLLNGEMPVLFPNLANYSLICATDNAYKELQNRNIKPDFISGDFDDGFEMLEDIEVIHTPNQDFTDFDKILQILVDRGHKNIAVYGASGKEQDHFLGNLHTAICFQNQLEITFYDNYGTYFLAKKTTKISNCLDKIISLIPLPKATKICTTGLQYPLFNEDLVFGKRIGTRNKAIANEVSIKFEEGELVVFLQDI